MGRKKGIDRENLIVDDIIEDIKTGENEGGKNTPVIVGSSWRGIKGYYLESGKDEVLIISLYSCLMENQKEKIKNIMLEMIERKILIREHIKNYMENKKK